MNKKVFTREEFLANLGLPAAGFREWEKLKLVKPAGFTDEKVPLYAEETAEKVRHIQKLAELGYGLEEIEKILKRVGLPEAIEKKRKPNDPDQYLTIGNLAERVGLSPRTIKHWEDKGIIEPDMRSEGGFRLYSGAYVYLCELVRDLQLFGYTLEEIKAGSDQFRYFLAFQDDLEAYPRAEVSTRLDAMLTDIKLLFDKMDLLEKGIKRWEDLLKKKRKEILDIKKKNQKRGGKKSKGD
jgi:DNA-binding transcriptional MerR regulator